MIEAFKELLNRYDRVSIVTHRNPDADTLGTALGIYDILKNEGKEVEVCNGGKNLPKHLDFLPHFARIKRQIDFDNSLIISCDSGSLDLLEFDLSLKEIVNIDHHKSNTNYGTLNIVDADSVSASLVAYNIFKDEFTITKESATCFYVAMVSDTQNFVTLNVNQGVFDCASSLLAYGVDLEEVNRNLTQRKSLSSLRILSATLDTLSLLEDAQLATMVVTHENMKRSGATYSDLTGLVDYGISLATVRVAIVVMEFENHLRVSIRSDRVDVSGLAVAFGGGGHHMASGFSVEKMNPQELLENITKEIKKRGLLYEL